MEVKENKQRILVIDDEEWSRDYLVALLEEHFNVAITEAQKGDEGIGLISRHIYDLVITDLNMPGNTNGLDVLTFAKKQDYEPEVMLVTGFAAVETAVEALKSGAFDYLTKPYDQQRVLLSMKQCLDKKSLQDEITYLRERLKKTSADRKIIAKSPAMNKVLSLVNMVSSSDANIIIEGENGSGKEVIAKLIHEKSPRSEGPFIPVNCSAIPENLIESEFFGYVKGAFTGAEKDCSGFFESANHGTLFLDEIGELPLLMQAKLLRALQDGKIQKVGSTKEIALDVRVFSATNRNLKEMIEENLFREDLYYRLHVVPVAIPPLRERKEDILPLIKVFIAKYMDDSRKKLEIEPDVLSKLIDYPWPGNVRQLENVIHGAIAICPGKKINDRIIQTLLHIDNRERIEPAGTDLPENYLSAVHDNSELRHISKILKECDSNKSLAAEKLGISRTTLWRKMKIFGLA